MISIAFSKRIYDEELNTFICYFTKCYGSLHWYQKSQPLAKSGFIIEIILDGCYAYLQKILQTVIAARLPLQQIP